MLQVETIRHTTKKCTKIKTRREIKFGTFKFNKTEIEGLYVIEPQVFGDDRGYFMETYNFTDFNEI